MSVFLIVSFLFSAIAGFTPPIDPDINEAITFLNAVENETDLMCLDSFQANWDFATNITDYNRDRKIETSIRAAYTQKNIWKRVQEWNGKWQNLPDEGLRRQFKFHSYLGTAALPEERYKKYETITTEMEQIYSQAKICDFFNRTKCDLSLEPEITHLLKESRNYDELAHLWTEWRKGSGRKIRNLFQEYIDLSNEAAKLNNFSTNAEMWLHPYESANFPDQIESLFNQVLPLYQQIHSYTRRKLREVYGENKVPRRGPIPAHLLGNMWSQTWDNIFDLIQLFPNKTSVDVTPTMKKKGMTPLQMFKMTDEFFTSLGLLPVTPEFWHYSIIEKPSGREIICHASAWDGCSSDDVRIKQCTRVDMEDFVTVHHEMGHVQYFLQYKDLPRIFREGANPGFHEAVGDLIALSVATPKHLHTVGLLEVLEEDDEADLNFLLKQGLDKVAFLPFAYILDLWRWKVFQGNVTTHNYNCEWWKLRSEVQGVKPPNIRTEEDFDPGAKYHVPASVPYVRYFVSFVLQFQFHKAVCLLAGQYDPVDPSKPLHRCDIYRSTEAGEAISNMLRLGASRPWPDALEALTGQRTMDASVLLEYFHPLLKWLQQDNEKHGEFIGWESDGEYCTS